MLTSATELNTQHMSDIVEVQMVWKSYFKSKVFVYGQMLNLKSKVNQIGRGIKIDILFYYLSLSTRMRTHKSQNTGWRGGEGKDIQEIG